MCTTVSELSESHGIVGRRRKKLSHNTFRYTIILCGNWELLEYWWLKLSDRLSQNVAICQVLVENAKDLVVQSFVHTNPVSHLLDGLQREER